METRDVPKLLVLCRTGSVEEQCRAIVDLEELQAREAVPVLLELTSSADTGVRANVAAALGKLSTCEVVAPSLLALLADPEALVRVHAIQSLGELRCAEALSQLMQCLASDADPLVRLQAAEALGDLREPASSPALQSALGDEDEGVRAYAAEALGQLGQPAVMPELRSRAATEVSPQVKASLLGALYQLGDDAALAGVLDLVDAVDDQLAATVLNMAAELTRPPHEALLRSRLESLKRTRPRLVAEAESLLPIGSAGRSGN
jgi:HEAT repeat protein